MNNYIPKVNDYVLWTKGVQGWVYFVDENYITIETKVWPKHPHDLPNGTNHRNERTLVVCYSQNWNQLQYVKSRKSVNEI